MKKTKFFKALGVGALATLGLFTFTGCSLSDNEKADLMKGLENANDYMEKHIDELEEQNYKLAQQIEELKKQNDILEETLEAEKEENDILQDYLEELQQENAKITTDEAYNKLILARTMLETNYNGIRDNFKCILSGIYDGVEQTATL